MTIKRFVANKDNTITNAFKSGNSLRGTTANMGASDILETFSIYAQASTSSLEQSRILIDFPIDDIIASRESGEIYASGSVSFKLKLFNAPHSQTTPDTFTISIYPVSSSWSEGNGLDMENYSDVGFSNWVSSSVSSAWVSEGGDYLTGSYVKDVSFDTGLEDLEVDISDIVEAWIADTITKNGLLIKLSGSAENGAEKKSYYTKRFFGRNSEFFLKRPVIEVQQSKVLTDDRGNLFRSSSLATSEENLNTIYFYNNFTGVLRDIPSTGSALLVQLVSSTGSSAETISGPNVSENFVTASKFSTGVYEAKFAYAGSKEALYDIWQIKTGAELEQIHTGSLMTVEEKKVSQNQARLDYVINVTNIKQEYLSDEIETFRVYTRQKNKTPNVYSKSTGKSTTDTIKDLYYKVVRVIDNHEVVGYSTSSSIPFSKLSYDSLGSFFELDMSILQPNYLYEISFMRKDSSNFVEQREKFRFRVKE